MNRFISTKDLLRSELFVREPVDELCKKLDNNTSKKIILSGGRGSGKSVTLFNLENKGIGTDKQYIYTIFDATKLFTSKPDDVFDELFFNHYYELLFSSKLLNYIKKYYAFTYEKHFKEFETLIYAIGQNTDNYINNAYFLKIPIIRYLKPTEISKEILIKFKNVLNIDSVSLAIDRFDWTNGNSKLSQIILSKFFDIFDKTIITTDDERILDENRKDYLVINSNYGNDLSIIKEIIERRIQKYNENIKEGYNIFPANIITDDIYEYLISESSGNITFILNCIGKMIDMWQWKDGNFNLNNEVDNAIEHHTSLNRTLKKMGKQPKLYL